MIERLKNELAKIEHGIPSHRASYAGLFLSYFCGCAGWIDKETVSLLATALYAALVAKTH